MTQPSIIKYNFTSYESLSAVFYYLYIELFLFCWIFLQSLLLFIKILIRKVFNDFIADGSSLNSLCSFQGPFNIMIITLYHTALTTQLN